MSKIVIFYKCSFNKSLQNTNRDISGNKMQFSIYSSHWKAHDEFMNEVFP